MSQDKTRHSDFERGRQAGIQECAEAITAAGAKLSISINESAVSGYYGAAEICRQLNNKETDQMDKNRLEKDGPDEPVLRFTADGQITFVLKDQYGRTETDVTEQVVEALRQTLNTRHQTPNTNQEE